MDPSVALLTGMGAIAGLLWWNSRSSNNNSDPLPPILQEELREACAKEWIEHAQLAEDEIPLLFVPVSQTMTGIYDRDDRHFIMCPEAASIVQKHTYLDTLKVVIKSARAILDSKTSVAIHDQLYSVNDGLRQGEMLELSARGPSNVDDLFQILIDTNPFAVTVGEDIPFKTMPVRAVVLIAQLAK